MEKKDRDFEDVLYLNGELLLFSSLLDKDLQKKLLFVETVDKTSLTPNGDTRKIGEIDYDRKRNSGSFGFKLSDDTSKVLIYYTLPYKEREAEKFGIQVFDTKMNQLWEEKITLPYANELFSLDSYQVDNEGNVVLLGRLYNQVAKERRNGEVNYKYIVLTYAPDDDVEEYEAKIDGKFLTDMEIAVDKEGDLVCAGFYSNKRWATSIMGTYYIRIDRRQKKC